MSFPFGHRRNELPRVSLGVPLAGVGIFPSRPSLGVQVIERALNHTRIHQQPFNLQSLVHPTFIRRTTVYEESLVPDADSRSTPRRRRSEAQSRCQRWDQTQKASAIYCRKAHGEQCEPIWLWRFDVYVGLQRKTCSIK